MNINYIAALAAAVVIFTLPALAAGSITLPERKNSASKQEEIKTPDNEAEPKKLGTAENEASPEEQSVTVFNTKSGENFSLGLEEYLCGVVVAEMPSNFEPEALKAQAIAARSYAIYRIQAGSNKRHKGGAALCTSYACCKAYISYEDALSRWGEEIVTQKWEIIKTAVYATAGEIITYNGKVCDAVFHSSSDGATENAVDLWGYEIPYLVSTDTPKKAEQTDVVLSAKDVEKIIGEDDITLGEVTRNKSGRVERVVIGDKKYSGNEMRKLFSLRSAKFEVCMTEDGGYYFTVHGYGHGVGMSQHGANELAKKGMDCKKILAHYYKGTEISYI